LLHALLLQIFYSIRSERQLMEQTQYNLLFRWFIGLSKNEWLSGEHFSVDRTQIQARSGSKITARKDSNGNVEGNVKGKSRSNDTN
jgi:transposase